MVSLFVTSDSSMFLTLMSMVALMFGQLKVTLNCISRYHRMFRRRTLILCEHPNK